MQEMIICPESRNGTVTALQVGTDHLKTDGQSNVAKRHYPPMKIIVSIHLSYSFGNPSRSCCLLKIVVTNFVNKGNSAEVTSVRLNAIRKFCARFPLVMYEELLQDLVEYRMSKQKSVMMAARSNLQLHRVVFGHKFLPLKERVRKLPII